MQNSSPCNNSYRLLDIPDYKTYFVDEPWSKSLTKVELAIEDLIAFVDKCSSELRAYYYIQSVSLAVSILRLFRMMRFQPELNIITLTLIKAWHRLASFFFVLLLLMWLFAAVLDATYEMRNAKKTAAGRSETCSVWRQQTSTTPTRRIATEGIAV